MTPLPKEPTGSAPIVHTVRQIIKCLREREIIAGRGVKVSKTGQGTKIDADGRSGTSAPEPESKVPRWG